jgi:hypothetical protein
MPALLPPRGCDGIIQLAENLPVGKRIGRDGKSRKMPKAKRMATPKLDRAREIVRPLIGAAVTPDIGR